MICIQLFFYLSNYQALQDHLGSMKVISFAAHVPDLTGKDDITVMNDYLSNHYSNVDWRT